MYKVVPLRSSWRARLVAGVAAFGIVAAGLVAGAAPAQAAPVQATPQQSIVPAADPVPQAADFKALVFSKTAGFRHGSIPAGIQAIEQLGIDHGFEVDTTEDGASFTDANLEQYDVVIWLSTTGDVLTAEQQGAFERYIQAGGGYAGVHAASDTEYDWPWYGELVGAYFQGHPANQNADIKVEDHEHPSSAHLDDVWPRHDEWYNFRTNPRTDVHVLMSLDETSYTGGTMGADHPIAWCSNYDGGRAWYSGGGHTDQSYTEPAFVEHLLGGIRTAAGVENADCNATQSDSFELVTLDDNTGNPMALDIADDSTVFYAERNGRVQRIDGETKQTTTALNLAVTLGNEDGLLGIVLDPDFASNGWAYVYWSPATVTPQDGPHNRISRYTYNFATEAFDPASEQQVLKVTTQRNTCCHAGGDMLFDNDGNLVLATGDNTNPFESDGYAPIDERAGRQDYDAQRTSANTNDLRGKVIRITPTDAGGYTVPDGNLFAEADDANGKTRPEIYAMGFRNPFRIGLDPYTNNLLVADYGPDAGSANANRGPGGTVEWNIVDEPGNYGWPLCVGIKCYRDYDFATTTSGAAFNPAAPVNSSPNNTGLTTLPPVIVPEWWTENGTTALYPEIGNSGAPMGGPVYQFDPALDSDTKWPAYWDGKAIFAEWNQGRMFSIQLNEDETDGPKHTEILDINRILPGIFDKAAGFNRSMDFEFGPDGALYVLDWGSDFGGNTTNSGVYRVDYVQANPSPIARAAADVTHGPGPTLDVQFTSEGTRHPIAKPYTIEWNFGDGSVPTSEANPTHTYAQNGEYTATLTATDEDGKTAVANVHIVVGNELPTVEIVFPESGGFFNWGDEVAYKVIVNDPDDADGVIDCSQVQVLPALGHDSHQHPMEELSGCEGSIATGRDGGHGIESNIFWVVDVRYTDDGGAVGVPLTGYGLNLLNPKHFEAEFFDQTGRVGGTGGDSDGVRTETTGDSAGGGRNVSNIETNDWWSYEPVNFKGIDGVTMRLAKGFAGDGKIQLRWNSPTGPTLGEVVFQPTLNSSGVPGWQNYSDFTIPLQDLPAETGTLYFVLTQGGANVNYIEWIGDGVDSNSRPVVELTASPESGEAPLIVDASVVASDPEGGAVTIEWNQGTGGEFAAGEASAQFTYAEPGSYQLIARVTDEQGAYTDESVTINANEPDAAMCLTGRSDGFDGETLDTQKWNRIVRPSQDARVEDGSLVLPATKTDIYGGTGAGNVPNIVLQDLPAGAWTATAKLTLEARTQYQQAGLIVYGDDQNYAKIAIQGRGTGSNAETRLFQFIREVNGVPGENALSNSPNLGVAFPDTVFVRFTSDGTSLNAWYSPDGQNFTMMPETKSLEGIVNPKIGVLAFANGGSPADVIDAKFDWFHITPDDTAVAESPNDLFGGMALDICRWDVVNEEPSGYRVSGGALQIDTTPNDIYGGDTGVPNIIVQDQPEGDWVVETKVDASQLDRRYQQGGLILHGDDDNYVKLDILATNEGGAAVTRNLEMRNEIGGVVQNPQPNAPAPASGVVWLRLAKTGTTFTGWHSSDGQAWTPIAETVSNDALANARVGLYALGNSVQGQVSNTAFFDYFQVVDLPAPVEVSASVAPSEPNGDNDWYTVPVTVTVDAEGGGESSVYREVNVDGAGWVEYTTPVAVTTDGQHTVEYRASAPGQEPDSGSVSFGIDATVPTATTDLDGEAEPRVLTIEGDDATSGIASLEYRIGDGEWQAYTAPLELDDTAQVFGYRATDAAGNVSADAVIDVPEVEPEEPVLSLEVAVDPSEPNGAGGWYTQAATVTATGTTTGEAPATVEYSTDGANFAALSAPLMVSTEGETTVWLRATDGEFVSPTEMRTIRVDTVTPTVEGAVEGRTVTLSGSDATSGVNRVEYRIGDTVAWSTYTAPIEVAGTSAATVHYRGVDVAGNASEAASVHLEDVTPEPAVDTITTGAPNKLTAKFGQKVKYTGYVFAFDGSTALGTVEIYDGSNVIATVELTAKDKGKYSVNLPDLGRGQHMLSAKYVGSDAYETSSAISIPVFIR